MKFLRKAPLSPFILTLYAVLSLWVVNFDQIPFFSIWRVLIQVLAIALAVLLFFRLVLRDWVKAGLMTSLVMLLFFVYGHIYNLVIEKEIAGFVIGRHRYLLVAAGIIAFFGFLLIVRLRKKKGEINLWVNGFMLLLLAFTSIQTGISLFQLKSGSQYVKRTDDIQFSGQTTNANVGDVYYIVLDSYAREDLLKDEFGFDNSEFISKLTEMGFKIPSCTLSNYDGTEYSMASTLNMNYLDQMDIPLTTEQNTAAIYGAIKSSEVRQRFENLGYQFVTFKTLYPFLDIEDSDYYYDYEQYQSFYNKIESINFQDLFFRTTVMRIPIEAQEKNPSKFDFLPDDLLKLINPRATKFLTSEYRLYQQYEFALEKLKALPGIPGKKFVYAHLFITHAPFVYEPDGSFRDSTERTYDAYRDQIVYANREIIEIIQAIIEKSDQPPIIIIQGDHAYRVLGEDRVKILNAYYLPDGGNDLVYESITPVNTFRLIFNQYFNENLDLLPDHSYHRMSTSETDVDFYETPGSCVK